MKSLIIMLTWCFSTEDLGFQESQNISKQKKVTEKTGEIIKFRRTN